MQSPSGKLPARLDWVDALRGVAILAVVFVHSAQEFRFGLTGVSLKLAWTGGYGVDLFFVISGFVLYHTYRRLAACSERPKQIFLFRRWVRLAPVYYVGILVYGWIVSIDGWYGKANIRESLLNLVFLNGWIPARASSVVPGGWSISAEATFALFFVAIVPLLSSSRRAFWACVFTWLVMSQTLFLVRAGLVSVIGKKAFESDFEFFVWPYMPTFMAGIWCWHAWNARQSSGQIQHPVTRVLCLLIALALLFGFSLGVLPWVDRTLIVGSACALAFHAWSAGPLPSILVSLLAYLGRLSYGLYLIHFGLVHFARNTVLALMPMATPWTILIVGTFLMTVAASLPLAWLSWKCLEHPIQTWAGQKK